MAKVRQNALLEELSGSIGDLVLKRARSGTMYVARKPRFPDNRQFSPAQLTHQQRFKAATAYAKQAAKTEPLYVALARKTGQPAYNVALGDYLHPPKIVAVEQVGETIRIRAEDQVKVMRVSVALLDAEGHILAEGEATPDALNWWWAFTAGHVMAARVRVWAYDLPGNKTTWEGDYISE
ncbi:MAG TPA: hypothetical protein VMP08_09720 [Anaerolineae bacterium]|nr:hypothetical protein [Anaerolineae bacterium]